ncbi:hypothetical protein [Synechococcus sp. ATX 2A4]|uniref:hypothetical protein n=1 Tax=Synechococcus sp. ATX 2A4 TaxID=2823727 RepID=UPI0020CBDD4F|nr:hypothetical protein [Synechococcus sp. ATX 2A4]
MAVFAFDRPDHLKRLLSVLKLVRPPLLLAVRDAPAPQASAQQRHRCEQVHRLLAAPGWSCEVVHHCADIHRGSARLDEAIDWVFEQVSEAIMLEDDLVPDPSFFRWCEAMLQRYRGDGQVLQISGRNPLGSWPCEGDDHHLVLLGSHLGAATWRDAWQRARSAVPPASFPAAADWGPADPLVVRHLTLLHHHLGGGSIGWDTLWQLQRTYLRGLVAIPPRNLIQDRGFDALATHNRNPMDLRATVSTGQAPPLQASRHPPLNARLDRWSLLLDLLSTHLDPAMARRLALRPALLRDPLLCHHLLPFQLHSETMAALEVLRPWADFSEPIAHLRLELSAFAAASNIP